jgi:hypothetical protein
MFLLILGFECPASEGLLDVPPRGRQNERAVTGGRQKVNFNTNTPLPVLIGRLDGDWEEVMTGKAYWFGYTDDMYGIAAYGDRAIGPLLTFAKAAHSAHAKYGALLALHLIGIDGRITGRFSEEFKNPGARGALLDCLTDDTLRDDAMRMLIRDPWPSDVPRLMGAMKNSRADCWTIVNGLFRYKLKSIPFRQAVPGRLADKSVAFIMPQDFGSDQFLWDILGSMKRVAGASLVLEDGLLQSGLWGYSRIGYGGGNAGPKEVPFAKILDEIVGANATFSYCDLGNRIQYFVEDGAVHICSSRTAKDRWLKWWDMQPEAYKRELSKSTEQDGAANRSQPVRAETNQPSGAAGSAR